MVKIEHLGFRYRVRGNWIFRDHTLSAKAGEVVAIIGLNGRGKTTLIKSILGLYRAQEGRVLCDGTFAYVPQTTEASFPYCARDMVVMGRARQVGRFGSPGRADYHKADVALAKLGMAHFADRPLNQLSGGQRQLVLIARALVSDAEVMILDEPATGLDFSNQRIILAVLRELARDDGITIFFTTHMPQHAQVIADKVLLMRDIDRYDFGPTAKVLDEANLSTLYEIDIRALDFDHNGIRHKVLVPVFV